MAFFSSISKVVSDIEPGIHLDVHYGNEVKHNAFSEHWQI